MDKTPRTAENFLRKDYKKSASTADFDASFLAGNCYLVPETVTKPLVTFRLTSASPGTCFSISVFKDWFNHDSI